MKYILMMTGTKADFDGSPSGRSRISRRNSLSCTPSTRNSRTRAYSLPPKAWRWPDQAKIVRAGKRRDADYRWSLPGVEGVSRRILDH